MNVGIDARLMAGRVRGMGKYAVQFISGCESDLIGLTFASFEKSNTLNLKGKGSSFYPLWEQITLPTLVGTERLDYLVCPYNTAPLFKLRNTKLILVVHDLIYLKSTKELPLSVSFFQTLGRFYRRLIVPRAIKKADFIITVSEFTKQELFDCFQVDSKKVTVIPNSISEEWCRLPPLPLDLRKNYIFTVSGEAPSKNVERLIKSFAIFQKENQQAYVLKIAGIKAEHHGKFQSIANQYSVGEQVEFLGFLSDEQLFTLYREARVFIFASLFEGFGIPLIEAMAAGTPVCCSNTTSMPEVVGDAAELFNPADVNQIAKAISDIIKCDSSAFDDKVHLGRKRVLKYLSKNVDEDVKAFWSKLNEN
ncbi:glycosyltransferase family 4 protein [Vibrio parahaemolyticus]|uniref:glycosyltransferase family 4 protein n=1 Tax=Vibrio parahaemolyticus TaxID=670 RepID=UPI0004D5ACE6|nr:glycosyltransferase family 1 protein [Vibrio parahaemolyticus]EGR2261000.1 glycosyltransferase family 1 protein [Vibrio parahaemolyticus]EGR3250714.1 glycosyltransferase family 1 protein [Vibrio parahaemolyticus]EHK2873925.1 glycosyltransferase family 4 protein [Vibrio parahaemolyticus]EHZ2748878.1 glycosyltransferase family 4 protein [Vibrio parahaemolyticus]EHZ7350110.1 glycosyltransferase family 4 protein [Vibrio parahaemolyticus]